MKKIISGFIFILIIVSGWFVLSEIYFAPSQRDVQEVIFEVEKNESVLELSERLEGEGVVRSAWFFRKFVSFKGLDTKIQAGTYKVNSPITLARVVESLKRPSFEEMEITIIPGWTLRDVANYFEEEGIATKDRFYAITGKPAFNYKITGEEPVNFDTNLRVLKDKSPHVSLEGYLRPDTFRIYQDSGLEEIIFKLVSERDDEITDQMYRDIEAQGRTFFEVLTMASILEKEVRSAEDKALVADLFWRRYDANWALQADSTVHYAVNKSGDVFTTAEDRDSTSPWNTYRYPGLPLGPISNPSLESIKAAIYPEENDYWYFLTTMEGEVKYARTLDGHNANVNRYLR